MGPAILISVRRREKPCLVEIVTELQVEALARSVLRQRVVLVGEIDFGFLAADFSGFFVVGSGGFFGGVEGAKPDTNSFTWIANLRGPFAPGPLPDPSVEVFPLPLNCHVT